MLEDFSGIWFYLTVCGACCLCCLWLRRWLGAIGEQEARHVAAMQLVLIVCAALTYDRTHICSGQGCSRLRESDEEDILRFLQMSSSRQFLSNGPQQFTTAPHQFHQIILGCLPQTIQVARSSQAETHQQAAQPSFVGCATCEINHHRFGLFRPATELHIGSQLRVPELEVVGKCADDMGWIL